MLEQLIIILHNLVHYFAKYLKIKQIISFLQYLIIIKEIDWWIILCYNWCPSYLEFDTYTNENHNWMSSDTKL